MTSIRPNNFKFKTLSERQPSRKARATKAALIALDAEMLNLEVTGPAYRFGKRLFDIALSLILLPFLVPLCLAIGVIIRIDSDGKALYRHKRLCRYGRSFSMWKFRTMCVNSDELLDRYLSEHPEAFHEWVTTHKLKNDPRITGVGRFLRKTSLDELPQFINVLAGHMSFVGPRPIVTAEVSKYGRHFGYFAIVKPGITGLWQVSGRSRLTYPERVALDRRYVREWSLLLDCKIMMRTVGCVLRGDGAC